MKILAVVDDRGGMMFNHRRVSRDRVVIQHITQLVGKEKLWVAPYSAELFPNALVDEDFLKKAGEKDWCFVEDCSIRDYNDHIDEVYLYHWNRRYPYDLIFDLPLESYQLKECTEFAGYSHEKITVEHYTKEVQS